VNVNPQLRPETTEQDAACFCDAVESAFLFLEDNYLRSRQDCLRTDFKFWGDANVSIRYVDPKERVDAKVTLWFASADLSVSFIEIVKGLPADRISYWGDKGYARAISLDTLVEYLTHGEVANVLPATHAGIKGAAIGKTTEMRRSVIRKDLNNVLDLFAKRCLQYGDSILRGDTSLFAEVQAFHTKKYRR
jgi:hypothetical protein